ncbi:hypothetical protein, partial [Stenotrophomonas maltophilia]|uniref:hypothetical protein n=1 Tax=Stenotrophomonas maltophilia TaxID=40324 RepID=UPI001953220C
SLNPIGFRERTALIENEWRCLKGGAGGVNSRASRHAGGNLARHAGKRQLTGIGRQHKGLMTGIGSSIA